MFDLDDTIVAPSSASGSGPRAIVRLSGPAALTIGRHGFTPTEGRPFRSRRLHAGAYRLPELAAALPADLLFFRAPATCTGQDVVEIHTLGSPPLVERLVAALLDAGARAAQPGEFTMRAFLAGKLDLTQAEAVLGVIEARSRDELRTALSQLAGGLAQPLQRLRDELLDLLADLEAGLDFSEEDIQFVSSAALRDRLGQACDYLWELQAQLDQRATGERPFGVVLAGPPNAGKSSLFNALAGQAQALVSAEPGTTRDYLIQRLSFDGQAIELIDTAGWQATGSSIEAQAQSLGRDQAAAADLILVCQPADQAPLAPETTRFAGTGATSVRIIATKCDRAAPPEGLLATSSVTGLGLAELRQLLRVQAQLATQRSLTPSLSRCRHHVAAALGHLEASLTLTAEALPTELVALELRSALAELGEMVGAVYTDDLLDRIFSRFCIGK